MSTITRLKGSVRVRNDAEPRIVLPRLKRGQYVVRLDTHGGPHDRLHRKTWDFYWTVWVVTP